jgi:hypothetical protein
VKKKGVYKRAQFSCFLFPNWDSMKKKRKEQQEQQQQQIPRGTTSTTRPLKMSPYAIHHLTVQDAPALARNNMAAFWEDANWNILWPKGTTLPFLITQASNRYPRNLLKDRNILRHEKAVDPSTGALLGYARWKLPVAEALRGECWTEAQVPDVSQSERNMFEKQASEAWWEPRSEMDSLDDENHRVKNRILGEGSFLGKSP